MLPHGAQHPGGMAVPAIRVGAGGHWPRRTSQLAPIRLCQHARGTTGAREASEPWWRGRRTRSFVVVAENSRSKKKRANVSLYHKDSCGALSPAPPPPPCFAGWSPSPAVAGADEELAPRRRDGY